MSYTSTDLEYEKQLTTSSTCSSEYTSPHKKELHPNVTYTPKKRNVCRKLFDDQDEFIQQLRSEDTRLNSSHSRASRMPSSA